MFYDEKFTMFCKNKTKDTSNLNRNVIFYSVKQHTDKPKKQDLNDNAKYVCMNKKKCVCDDIKHLRNTMKSK